MKSVFEILEGSFLVLRCSPWQAWPMEGARVHILAANNCRFMVKFVLRDVVH